MVQDVVREAPAYHLPGPGHTLYHAQGILRARKVAADNGVKKNPFLQNMKKVLPKLQHNL